jgi:hypothetical protein
LRGDPGRGFGWLALLALAPAEDAGGEAHDFLLDQAQHFRVVVNVPELDLLGPAREPLLQQRQVFGLLQSDDPIRPFEVVGRHLRRQAGDGLGGTHA